MKRFLFGPRGAVLLFVAGFVVLLVVVSLQRRVRSAARARGRGGAVGVVQTGAPPTAVRYRDWAAKVNLGRAMLEDGRLVQELPGGTRLRFTLEPELQQTADQLLRRYEIPYASIVVLSVRTGRVLVMSGSSKADPRLTPRQLALGAWAPAASVFKLITTAALIERNKARPMSRVCYHGGLRRLSAANLSDNPVKDKTCRTLSDAVGMSINPVIGKLARKHLSRDELLDTANRFGFNATVDFDLPMQASSANIPREAVARAKVAAGFWHTTMSPLHGALIAQVFANGGTMIRPRLVDEVRLPGGALAPLPERWRKRVTTAFTARVVGRMMVLTTTLGTAKDGFYDKKGRAYLPAVKVAAKTGSLSRRRPPVDYNWLVGFAPYDRPQVAFSILLGNELKWRTKPYYLARILLKAIFAHQRADRESGAKAGPGASLKPSAAPRPPRARR